MGFPPEIGPYFEALKKVISRIRLKPKWVGLIAIPLAFVIGAANWKYGSYAQALVAMALWFWLSHKNPSLSPAHRIHADTISGGGFTFFSFGRKRPSFFDKERDESGLLWEGFSMGVCRPNSDDRLYEGKVYSIAVWLYGTNEGVGHYSYKARSDRFSGFYGQGHFNLMPFEAGSDLWRWRVLSSVGTSLALDLQDIMRPIEVAYDRKTGIATIYDPESGRDVGINEDRRSATDDLFVFGPYPSKVPGWPATPPGITVTPAQNEGGQAKTLRIRVVDIYGRMVSRALVTVQCAEGSGYSYTQMCGPAKGGQVDARIAIPIDLTKIRVQVKRGGYGDLEAPVDADGSMLVLARMEPTR